MANDKKDYGNDSISSFLGEGDNIFTGEDVSESYQDEHQIFKCPNCWRKKRNIILAVTLVAVVIIAIIVSVIVSLKTTKPVDTPVSDESHGSTVTAVYGSFTPRPCCYNDTIEDLPSCCFNVSGMAAVKEDPYVHIPLEEKPYLVYLTAIQFLPDGRFIVCDKNNKNIKLLSSNFKIESTLELGNEPHDVAVINGTTVAVTIPLHDTLEFVHVVPSLQLGTILQLDMECSGIDALNDTLYLICFEAESNTVWLRFLDFDGKSRGRNTRLYYDDTHYDVPVIAVSHVSGKICFSDHEESAIRCISEDGKSVYNYSDISVEYTSDLLLDDLDNIVVCDSDQNNLLIIDSNGKKQRKLLTSANGLQNPRTLAYRQSDSTLVVGSDRDLLVFKLTIC